MKVNTNQLIWILQVICWLQRQKAAAARKEFFKPMIGNI